MTLHGDLSLNGSTAWLCCASFLAGILNSVAGGGSFLSFPALLHMGVAPIEANATNTVALWPGQLTSIAAYRRDFGHYRELLPVLGAAAVLGGLGGATVLLRTRQGTFLHLVPWLLLVAATLFAVSAPLSRWLQRRTRSVDSVDEPAREHTLSRMPLFFAVLAAALYIGFFGAGSGFLIMALLGVLGVESITQINALKVVATTLANGAAVVLFILQGRVLWQDCLLMMVTSAVGGYLGARSARRLNHAWVRSFVTGLGFAMAGYFFWREGLW